jgi:hypothetical protein
MKTLGYRRLGIVLWGVLRATLLLTKSVHSFTKTLSLTSKTSSTSTSTSSCSRRCMGQALLHFQQNPTQERNFRRLQQVLWNTTCSKCTTASSSSSLDDTTRNRTLFHVTMVVTGPYNNNNSNNNNNNNELISLAAGLLTENVQVTLLLLIVEDHPNNSSSSSSNTWNDTITTQILNRVPCEQESTAKRLLYIRLLTVHEELTDQCQQNQSSSLQSACGLEMVNSTLHLLQQHHPQRQQYSNNTTNVWILQATSLDDPTLVGALLYAEQFQLPTIALTHSKAILDLVLQHDPEWTPYGNIISRMLALLHQRWHSLGLTKTVLRWNHIRRRLSFPALHPMDFFPTVVTLIVPWWAQEDTTTASATQTEIPEDSSSSHSSRYPISTSPNRVLFGSIYPPPCSPCLEKDTILPTSPSSAAAAAAAAATVQDDNATASTMVILVQPPPILADDHDHDWTPASIRELMRGLALVKTSLESYDDCEWDSLTCWKPQHVRVVWLMGGGENDTHHHAQFPIWPSFVHAEPANTNILDSIARQPKDVSTTMVLSSCEQGDTQVLAYWGVRVMCWSSIPSSSSSSPYQARDLAIRLLELLRQPVAVWNSTTTPSSSSSLGLPQVVSLVRRIAETQQQQQQQKTPWTSIEQMQRQINLALLEHHGLPSESSSLEEDELLTHPPYDTFTVLIAWLVILASLGYIGLKDSSLSSSSNLRWKTRRHASAASSMAQDGILKRLPDLDEAWTALVDWYKDQPLILRESPLMMPSTLTRRNRAMSETSPSHGGHPNSHNHHHHHSGNNIRRRRKR